MSNLSNLYISASYKGIINLADSTEGINSQSNYELQDGLGNGIGVSILSGSVLVDNEISSSTIAGIGNAYQFSQSVDYRLDQLEIDTGSQDARLDLLEIASQSLQNYTASLQAALTASGTDVIFSNNVTIPGELRVYKIHTTIESSSVILSSGSNQLGDEPSDTQIFSGSVYVPNLHYLAGNPVDTNLRINQKLDTGSYLTDSASFDIRIDSKLDSSWTSSVFLPYSSSVAAELATFVADALPASWTGSVFLPFSTSVDSRLTAQEDFSSSLVFDFVTTTEFNTYTSSNDTLVAGKLNTSSYDIDSASFDTRITDLEDFSSSLDLNFVSEVEFAAFSSSNETTITNLSSSIAVTDVHQTSRIDNLASFTGSYATTGSNNFIGNQDITGSVLVSGSFDVKGPASFTQRVKGTVHSDSVVGGVINLDLSQGNFFDVTLQSGSNAFSATNIQNGMNVTVKLNLPSSGYSNLSFDTGSFQFPRTFPPLASDTAGGVDILTFVTFDNTLYGIINNDFTPVI